MSTASRRVLVAGATGYLGSFVAREFKRRGHLVRALARSAAKLKGMEDELDEIVVGEVTKPETIRGICDGMDVVFSSIGIKKQKGKLTFKDVDYQSNRNLLEVAARAGTASFIYTWVFRGPSLLHLEIVRGHDRRRGGPPDRFLKALRVLPGVGRSGTAMTYTWTRRCPSPRSSMPLEDHPSTSTLDSE